MRYVLEKGAVMAVGTGSNPEHVVRDAKDNLGTLEYRLTAEEVKEMEQL